MDTQLLAAGVNLKSHRSPLSWPDEILSWVRSSFFSSDSIENGLLNLMARLLSLLLEAGEGGSNTVALSHLPCPRGMRLGSIAVMSLKWRRSIFGVMQLSSTFQKFLLAFGESGSTGTWKENRWLEFICSLMQINKTETQKWTQVMLNVCSLSLLEHKSDKYLKKNKKNKKI